ncbi:hypothetical protein M758_3G021900 [Ceratodon purpureus]|uniref:Uncharacterized protein n=1 Tax=Ceratodon purpureus TaxID=3225 RepID=A0A8T0IDY2_CERPU|nr:hypothetical protein KC19_3G021700 [Ceratodon purpureus]KAG0621464.1 hypothetical protein M758_3G021900 [Ceratodon purpureus]
MLLQSSPTSFLLPAPSLPSNPRSGSSAPFCPLVAKQGQVVGWKSTPSAKRRKVEVMANSAPAAAGTPLPGTGDPKSLRLLFVEMGTGYDQHGQDVTAAAVRACKNAISSNSIPAFRTGALPGVSYQQMKLRVKLGVPHSVQKDLDIEKVKAVFPYGEILEVEVVDGGLICSSGVALEAMGDKNDDCYVVNAAVYVGY